MFILYSTVNLIYYIHTQKLGRASETDNWFGFYTKKNKFKKKREKIDGN